MINSLLDNQHLKKTKSYCLLIDNLTNKQCFKTKSSIINANNCLNKVHPLFNRLHQELLPEFQLVNNFPNCFLFHSVNYHNPKTIKAHLWLLDYILEESAINLNIVIVLANTSVKNNIATSISHIISSQNTLKKIIHHTVNITSTEA